MRAILIAMTAWLCVGCGDKAPAGSSCQLDKAGECASGYCVSFTCTANSKDVTVCTRQRCGAGDSCPAGDFCLAFPSGNRHCIPESACN